MHGAFQYRSFLASIGCAVIVGFVAGNLWFSAPNEADSGIQAERIFFTISVIALLGATCWHLRRTQAAERKKNAELEQKSDEYEDRLKEAQKLEALGRLTGGVAHDFNNLVTVIGCSVGLLAEAIDESDPRTEELTQIKDATERATVLTRQLLSFTRRQHLQSATPRPLNFNKIILDLEKMLNRILGSQVKIQTELCNDIGLVSMDQGQLEQILVNLAINSRDAMPNGGTLTFKTQNGQSSQINPVPSSEEYTCLIVHDTGVGMPKSVMENAFRPFFTTKESAGTGLGLSTVQAIMNEVGGHIMVDSIEGKGTSIILHFPSSSAPSPGRASTGKLFTASAVFLQAGLYLTV